MLRSCGNFSENLALCRGSRAHLQWLPYDSWYLQLSCGSEMVLFGGSSRSSSDGGCSGLGGYMVTPTPLRRYRTTPVAFPRQPLPVAPAAVHCGSPSDKVTALSLMKIAVNPGERCWMGGSRDSSCSVCLTTRLTSPGYSVEESISKLRIDEALKNIPSFPKIRTRHPVIPAFR